MSYMNRKNILSEGFFDSIKNLFKGPKFSKEERKLMRSPAFRKSYTKFKKHIDAFDVARAKARKELGLDT